MALKDYIKEVSSILKREIRSFNIVHELLILEEQCLVKCDTKGLEGILERQEDVFSSIACLEKSRMELVEKIAGDTGVGAEDVTISFLAGKVDGALTRELNESGHILTELDREIRRRKSTNSMLINQSILLLESDIRVILNAFNGGRLKDNGYSSNAKKSGSGGSMCVDARL